GLLAAGDAFPQSAKTPRQCAKNSDGCLLHDQQETSRHCCEVLPSNTRTLPALRRIVRAHQAIRTSAWSKSSWDGAAHRLCAGTAAAMHRDVRSIVPEFSPGDRHWQAVSTPASEPGCSGEDPATPARRTSVESASEG